MSTWHSVHEKLPAIDDEVIVLNDIGRISFGHMVNKDIAVDYDGWNVPNVVFWRECEFTKDMNEFYGQDNV